MPQIRNTRLTARLSLEENLPEMEWMSSLSFSVRWMASCLLSYMDSRRYGITGLQRKPSNLLLCSNVEKKMTSLHNIYLGIIKAVFTPPNFKCIRKDIFPALMDAFALLDSFLYHLVCVHAK